MRNPQAQSDEVTASRLRKLAAMPVDLTRLDQLIQNQIPRPALRRLTVWFRPLRVAIAASVMLGVAVAIAIIATSGGPVQASTTEMARFHDDLVSGRVPVMRVDTISAANQALAAQWEQSPRIPNIPMDHVMACCMRSVKNKKMACVLFKGADEPVTMTVAKIADMQLPQSPVTMCNNVEFHVQSVGNLNMVMTPRQGCWICLISRLPADRLMDLAINLKF